MFDCDLKETNDPLSLEVLAKPSEMERIQKFLTITNSSVSYQLKKLREKLSRWKDSPWVNEEMFEAAEAELKELKADEKEELFVEIDGKIYIPAGFFYIGRSRDLMINDKIKPVFHDGLRYYQKEAIDAMLQYKRNQIQLPTGMGKSRIIASLALSANEADMRCCIIVPSEYLVGQTVKVLEELGMDVTGASGKRIPKLGTKNLVVTAGSAKKFVSSYHTVIIDENHHISAHTYRDIAEASRECYAFWSLSATPFRADGLDLVINALSGPLSYRYDIKRGIAEGWLNDVDIYAIKMKAGVEISSKSLATSAYKKIFKNKVIFAELFKMVSKSLDNKKKPIIVFKTVLAGREFQKFCKGKIDFDVATGEYKKPLIDFVKGDTNILVACDKLVAEGLDLVEADTLYLLTQHASDITTYQTLGRILRKKEGKPKSLVVDIQLGDFKQFAGTAIKRNKVYSQITDNFKIIGI
jgi:superfamily II DNA or RNA helicase